MKQRMKHCASPGAPRQQGFSLIELMIGLVLGLIVVSAVINTYVGSSRSAKFSQGLQRMQENGRYAMSTLQNGVRLAGYSPAGDLNPFDIGSSGPNTIVVQMRQQYDCNGVDTAAVGGIAINTYTHDPVDDIITCTGNSATASAMEIVDGVESMRVLWGIDTDNNDIPERYIPYDAAINPQQVIGLRLAILVSSGNPIRTRASEETHILFDQEITTNDRIARNVFSSTVMLRNRSESF